MEIKTLAKNTAILASPKIVKFFIGIVRAKLIAVFLGVTGAGIIDQLQDTISQIRDFSLSSLPDGMVKLIAQQNGIDADIKVITSIVKTYLYMVFPVTVIITVLGYYFSNEITIYIFGDIKYLTYFQIGFVAVPVSIFSTTSNAMLKAYKKVKSFAIAEVSIIVVNLIIFIPLIYFYKIPGAVVYVTLSFVTTFFIIFYLMRKNVMKEHHIKFRDIKNASFSTLHFRELLNYMGVGIVGGTFFIITEVSTRAIVVNELGIEKLGVYSPITRWASLFVGFILPSVFTYLYPRLSEAKSDPEIVSIINDVIRLITFITMPFVIIGIATRDWIIPIFYSNDFAEATVYLPYHFSALILVIWSSILSQLFYATGRLKSYLIFGLIINSISLGLVYFFVPDFGLYGYLLKFTIIPLIMIFTYFIFWRQEIKLNIKKENIILMLYAMAISLILLLLKDADIYLQIFGIVFMLSMIFFLNKQEKNFLIKKLKGIRKKKQ